MENASKALIIAGAILISILLISVGILVMNSTSGMQDEMLSQMDQAQKQSFNAGFTTYSGTNKTASDVRSLYNQVNSSNATHDDSLQVTMTLPGTGSDDATKLAELSTRIRYRIVVNVNSTTGVVDTITVTPASSGSGTGGSSTPASSH